MDNNKSGLRLQLDTVAIWLSTQLELKNLRAKMRIVYEKCIQTAAFLLQVQLDFLEKY